jgi:serine/threonine protein kinase
MRHIKHENIINLHEVFEGEQHIYLVMDLLKGGELFDRIVNQSHFGEKDSFELIFQLINAI